MSYKLAGVNWNDDGSMALPDNTITADMIKNSIVTNICISDSIENLHIQYKGKEYKFNLEKALKLLCEVIDNEN